MSREDRAKESAQDVLDRAEREVRSLSATGMDVAALNDRYATAKTNFDEGRFTECESLCSEILVLAKSMGAIASASMNAGRGGGGAGKLSEALKLEIGRMISSEVSSRVESVVRNLPTTSAIEELIQGKIQEALVTGGLMARLEGIAGEKAEAAIATMPKFTAKDAQAAANLVVQRALTQFLASKELGKRVKAAVEAELVTAVDESMAKVTKETDALVNTRVASLIAPLPTSEAMMKHVHESLRLFTKDEAFETRVLELATERAKAEVQHAPDIMSESAGRIARNEADALFKTRIQSPEFVDQVKASATEAAKEAFKNLSHISAEDVEVISRRVAEDSLGSLAESDVLKDKIENLARDIVGKAMSAAGFDEKARAIAREEITAQGFDEKTHAIARQEISSALDERMQQVEQKLAEAGAKLDQMDAGVGTKVNEAVAKLEEITKSRPTREEVADAVGKVRQDIMTSPDFSEWIKDGVKAILNELELGEGLAGLEKVLVTSDKVEKIARHEALTAAMDLLETKEFTRRVVALLDETAVREKVEEISGGSLDVNQIEVQIKNVMMSELDNPDIIEKIKASGGGDAKELSKRLIERMDRIEKEALPAIVDRLLTEKLGVVTGDALTARVSELVSSAVATQLNPQAMQEQVLKIAQENIKDIANTPGFKTMLDEKFKVMMKYLTQDVIPKQVKKVMSGG